MIMNVRQENQASEFILSKTSFCGNTAIILGSGLGEFAKVLNDRIHLAYSKIPYYPISNVKGHIGELVIGNLFGKEVIIANGRVHFYEGYDRKQVTFPVRVFKKCGIKNLIITNSSGSMQKKNKPGTLMIIKGHIDCTFQNHYKNLKLIKSSNYYSKELIGLTERVAIKNKIEISLGNYCWVLGPSYETPEEIKYFRSNEGDAIGMSTLPEIEEASEQGLKVLSVALLTNYAAGINKNTLSHEEVIAVASKSKTKLIKLLSGIIKDIKE